MNDYKYDVALSFAGEDREYVENVATNLITLGITVFYDSFETVDLWGKNLYQHLNDIYKNKARYCVIFISDFYKKKLWTNHELRSAQARAFRENREYILPARFDLSTEIPGVNETIGYINLNEYIPEDFAKLICSKVNNNPPDRSAGSSDALGIWENTDVAQETRNEFNWDIWDDRLDAFEDLLLTMFKNTFIDTVYSGGHFKTGNQVTTLPRNNIPHFFPRLLKDFYMKCAPINLIIGNIIFYPYSFVFEAAQIKSNVIIIAHYGRPDTENIIKNAIYIDKNEK